MNEDVEKLFAYWKELYTKQPPSFKEFAKTIKIYKPKYKWRKLLPFWFLKIIVKPTTFYNCFPKAIDSVCGGEGNLTFSVKMNYKNDL
jgi:hypothetical protein